MKNLAILVCVLCLCVAGAANADTVFTGTGGTIAGDLSDALNWDNGAPDVGNPGVINVNGTTPTGTGWGETFGWGTGNAPLPGVVITIGGGAVLDFDNDATAFNCDVTINNATLNCGDDFYAPNDSHHVLNAGSVVTADYLQVQGTNASITINGGTHTALRRFGTQNKAGSGMHLLGGTSTAGADGGSNGFTFYSVTSNTIGGSADLIGSVEDATGTINFLPGWTGSWTNSAFGVGDWEAVLTDAATGFQLNGVEITGANVGSFAVSVDGTTLTIPEPATMVLLGLGSLLGLRRKK